MSKIEIDYEGIDEETKIMLQGKADIVKRGSILRDCMSPLQWRIEKDEKGRNELILSPKHKPDEVFLKLPPENIERMSDEDLKLRIGGVIQ